MVRKVFFFFFIILVISAFPAPFGAHNADFPAFSELVRPYKTISPFMSRLLNMTGRDLDQEVEMLWDLGKRGQLPLVEPDPMDTEYRYLTLVYRDDSEKNFSFEVFGIYDETCFGDMQLRRVDQTDVRYRCYKVPKSICFSYRFKVTDPRSGKTEVFTDPFNPNRVPTGPVQDLSYSVLDLNPMERNWNIPPKNPTGSRIETLTYVDGIVEKKRTVTVYLPSGYTPNRQPAYPTLYLFDSQIYIHRVEVANILDNLIEEKKIEPVIAVLFGTYRNTRDIILPLNFAFKEEFMTKFLPFIRNRYHTSTRPEDNIIGGMSYGGLAATFIAFYHPDVFGKVLSQSGSFWRGLQFDDEGKNWLRFDWLIEKFLSESLKKLILFLDWGLQENWVKDSNRRMVRVLKEKGYTFTYKEFNGWHDWSNSRKSFVRGLLYLWGASGSASSPGGH